MTTQLVLTLPRGYEVEQPAPPTPTKPFDAEAAFRDGMTLNEVMRREEEERVTPPTEPEIIVTREALQQRADELARMGCFQESALYYEYSDAAALDACPIRLSVPLARRLGLVGGSGDDAERLGLGP